MLFDPALNGEEALIFHHLTGGGKAKNPALGRVF